MSRIATCARTTKETDIQIFVDIDGTGKSNITTDIGFFNHMLTHFSKYSFIDIDLTAKGDIEIDAHHTVEDIGIVLGDSILEALGEKEGIKRYGSATIPMDETLVTVAIDLSGRPYLQFDAPFTVPTLGNMETELFEEFFRAFSNRLKMNCHVVVHYGKNNHHIAEGIFKALGMAMDMAVTVDARIEGQRSTKGQFD